MAQGGAGAIVEDTELLQTVANLRACLGAWREWRWSAWWFGIAWYRTHAGAMIGTGTLLCGRIDVDGKGGGG